MIYPRDDERAMRVQRMLDDWTTSGLLSDEQRQRMRADVAVDYRRTNRFLRATLFLFGYLILNALFGLMAVLLDPRDGGIAVLALVAAVASFLASQAVIERYRFYRFGIEEALAVASVSFFALGCAMFMRDQVSGLQFFIGASGAAFIVFRRFAFLYAGVAAVLLAGMIPFNLQAYQGDTTRRLFAIVFFLVIFGVARERRRDHGWDFPGDLYGVLETTAWAAIYLLTNLEISEWLSVPDGYPLVHRIAHAGIWILPAAGLFLAVRERHRWMLDANLVMAIVTLMSNRLYLGTEPKPWDPIVLGLLLSGIALVTKRWLSSGADGSRAGVIADRLLASEQQRLSVAGAAAALAPGAPGPRAHPSGPEIGDGGRSGGAGASGSF